MKRQRIRKAILLISFLLFPVTMNFLSPYLIMAGAGEGVITGSFLFFGVLLVGSLFLGRAFCGWLCPGGGLQRICISVNGRRVPEKVNWIKYAIWAPWLLGIAFLLWRSGGAYRVDPLYMTESGISVDAPQKYIIYYFVVGLLLVLSLTVGRRAGCHILCWMAPFMVIGAWMGRHLRIPQLRVTADGNRCRSCRQCQEKCPMSLPVMELVRQGGIRHTECILCGECVDSCPAHALHFTMKPVGGSKNGTASKEAGGS